MCWWCARSIASLVNLAKQLAVERELKNAGVQIEYALSAYPDTPEGNLLKNVRASIAEFERELITQRSVRGRRLKVKAGNVIFHGHLPYGYRLAETDGKRSLVVYEPEAQVVRNIFAWYTEGDGQREALGARAIARRLTELRIPSYFDTRGERGVKQLPMGHWAHGSIGSILSNETYCGVWHYGKFGVSGKKLAAAIPGELIAVDVPAIVSRQQWDAAQKRKLKNKAEARRNMKNQYLMSKRLVCSVCEGKVAGISRVLAYGTYLYYQCTTNRQGMRRCSVTFNYRADEVDAGVWSWIKSLLIEPTALEDGIRASLADQERAKQPLRDRLNTVQDLLAENQAQLNRLLDLYLVEGFPREMLLERKTRLEDTIRSLTAEEGRVLATLEAHMLTEEQIKSLREFSLQIADGLDTIEQDFETRRRLVEILDVRGRIALEDGCRVVYVECFLDESVFTLSKKRRALTGPSDPESPSADGAATAVLYNENNSSQTCARGHTPRSTRKELR